ncbi:DNA/RNA helicase domain-containing protein [Herbiconiux liangxiaofengii]|uniref:DNA/RNA helicase domain-containing protein n=1 Tax=Herbiconiux liangxiaofengii TaxID=3342795 RepID=UPI0035B80A72
MTSSEIVRLPFDKDEVGDWARSGDKRITNWPVVYILDDDKATAGRASDRRKIYVGESLNVATRMRQHLASIERSHLTNLRVILDETFNKSVCLDLESFLIEMLSGDGAFEVLNRNDGIVNADYYNRAFYQDSFDAIFDRLKLDGVFTRTIPEIINSDLFKLSPFKSLTDDQAFAVEGVVKSLFDDLRSNDRSTTVIQGDPGTGKTVVAIYLLKLLADIRASTPLDALDDDGDSLFSEFFTDEHRMLLRDLRIGFVIPQQSLHKSVQRVFRKTPGLDPSMVLTAFDVGESATDYGLLIVDETHRLNQRANQPAAALNIKFRDITTKLFGNDDTSKTQLDWITAKSAHQIFLVDPAQSVKPADIPIEALERLVADAKAADHHHPLLSQMRVRAGSDYVGHVRRMLGAAPGSGSQPLASVPDFGDYDFRMFDDVSEMRAEIVHRDREVGLSRLVAGYAWEWKTKGNKPGHDIEIGELRMRWNSTQTDWIASPGSLDEVGSIHTVQGYDLNYAGVIIGPDLRFDTTTCRIVVDRASYFDKKGKEANKALGRIYSDDDLLWYIRNVYAVLLTRGIRGTYLYVHDPALREHLWQLMPDADSRVLAR